MAGHWARHWAAPHWADGHWIEGVTVLPTPTGGSTEPRRRLRGRRDHGPLPVIDRAPPRPLQPERIAPRTWRLAPPPIPVGLLVTGSVRAIPGPRTREGRAGSVLVGLTLGAGVATHDQLALTLANDAAALRLLIDRGLLG